MCQIPNKRDVADPASAGHGDAVCEGVRGLPAVPSAAPDGQPRVTDVRDLREGPHQVLPVPEGGCGGVGEGSLSVFCCQMLAM